MQSNRLVIPTEVNGMEKKVFESNTFFKEFATKGGINEKMFSIKETSVSVIETNFFVAFTKGGECRNMVLRCQTKVLKSKTTGWIPNPLGFDSEKLRSASNFFAPSPSTFAQKR